MALPSKQEPFLERKPTPNGEDHPDHAAFPRFSSGDEEELLGGPLWATKQAWQELNPRRPPFQCYVMLESQCLTDSGWPPKSLRSRERHANHGLESWVKITTDKPPIMLRCRHREPRSLLDHHHDVTKSPASSSRSYLAMWRMHFPSFSSILNPVLTVQERGCC